MVETFAETPSTRCAHPKNAITIFSRPRSPTQKNLKPVPQIRELALKLLDVGGESSHGGETFGEGGRWYGGFETNIQMCRIVGIFVDAEMCSPSVRMNSVKSF